VEWLRQIGLKVVTNWEANLTAARVAQNKRDVLAARITEQPPDFYGRQGRGSVSCIRLKEAQMFRTATSALCLAILVGFPVLGQRMALNHSALTFAHPQNSSQPGQISGNCPEPPATHLVTYQKYDLEIRHPENWYISETGNTVTLAPEGGIVEGKIACGMLIDTYHPRNRSFGNSFSAPELPTASTLSSATDHVIEELRRTNANLRVLRSSRKQLGANAAMEVELSNDSPLGGREIDRLTTVLHNGVVYYFLGVAPESEMNRYSAVFDRMISSIRFN